jgi:hypothetical protein
MREMVKCRTCGEEYDEKHDLHLCRLSVGQRVTLFRIDDMLAWTHRFELEVRRVILAYTEGDKRRVAAVRQKGRRKEFCLDLAHDDILLDGWGPGFRTDGEAGGAFNGNACYNFVGDPDVIRQAIETTAVYPVSADAKAKILVTREPRTTIDNSDTIILYPDIETHHAVINRMKMARQPE